jgi:uncharacterized YccA/Bax inhibitor family protein
MWRRTKVRTSSNPAFRSLPTSPGGYARFGPEPGPAGLSGASLGAVGYGGYGPGGPASTAKAGDRPLTVDDIVQKTAINLALAIAAGVAVVATGFYALGLVGFVVGLVLSLIIIFRRSTNKFLVMGYSLAEGLALGSITGLLQSIGPRYASIGMEAILATLGVFIGMLVVYKTGAIRVTPRLYRMVIGAAIGAVLLMVVNLVVGFFVPGGIGLRDGGLFAILFSLVCIAIGAFMLLLDFDQAENAVNAGVPARFAWYLAFGFMTTLVWIYIEILNLLASLRGD